ncbi:sensor histidine kinase [Spirillospora sp. CA-294931]|uniref:sensor histidine kinase n=1 Tax=Spirillospora sp. CA-294931 TaxID=3240042 RepID=UPI003D8BEB95
MSNHPPSHQARLHWPLPSAWPVWVAPVFLAFIQLFGSFGAEHGPPSEGGPGRGPDWDEEGMGHLPLDFLGVMLILGGPVALLFRRRYPRATLAVVGAITSLYFLRAYTYGPVPFSAGVAILAALVAGHRLYVWAGTSAVIAVWLGITQLIGVEERGKGGAVFPVEQPSLVDTSFIVGWSLVALIGGELIRMRGQKAAESARTRAEEERRQASEERLRMARELHDVLAHNISMINVQAGVALHLLDDDPQQARTALAAIKEASKEALTEMRSVIGVLRSEGERAPRSPTAGMERLEELLNRARSAGLRVDAEITGDRRPLPAGPDLAAFRIVQESLTNVSRHAGGGPVTVRLRIAYGEHDVAVQVDDDGQGVSLLDDHHSGGSGINGMRERAVALGGTFEAGPRPGGGFGVRASLPLTGERTASAESAPAGGTE